MTNKEYSLLVAIGSWLEYRSSAEGARGFVREPIYNVAKSFNEYLESLPESEQKTLLEMGFSKYTKGIESNLKHLYQS